MAHIALSGGLIIGENVIFLHPGKDGLSNLMGLRRLNIAVRHRNQLVGSCSEKSGGRAVACHSYGKLGLIPIALIRGGGSDGQLAGIHAADSLEHIINPLAL